MYAKPAEGVISSLPDSVSLVDSAFVSVSVFDPLVDSVSVIGSLSEDMLVESLSFFPQAVTAAAAMHMTRAAMIAIKPFFMFFISLYHNI
jgi:hypothetical protein